MCQALLKTFYDSVVSSVILYAVTCWGGGLLEKEKNKLNNLIKKAGSVVGCVLPTIDVIAQDRMTDKLVSITPLSGPDLIYISLLIIPCIIYYVTNKETLNLEYNETRLSSSSWNSSSMCEYF